MHSSDARFSSKGLELAYMCYQACSDNLESKDPEPGLHTLCSFVKGVRGEFCQPAVSLPQCYGFTAKFEGRAEIRLYENILWN